MNSHLVSRVILRNFADKDKKIRVYDKGTHAFLSENRPINDVCNLELSDSLFSESEKQWSKKIETKIANLMAKYDGNFYDMWCDERSHPALRRLLTLHFVRSMFFFSTITDLFKQQASELLGSIPESFHEEVLKKFASSVARKTPGLINEYYKKVKTVLDGYELELAEASPTENFVIGDIAILNNKSAMLDSKFFIMPLSPRYALSVAKEKRFFRLSTRDTRKIKKMAKHDAINNWFCLPK